MGYSKELSLRLLLKCVNCDLDFKSDVESVTTIIVQKNIESISATADAMKYLSASNSSSFVEEIKIIDAVSYIHGISYCHLLGSFLKFNCKSELPNEKKSSKTTRVAVDDSNVAVALCSKCSNLLEELYNAFKSFDKASTTRSILKGAVGSFRGDRQIDNFGEDDTVQVKLEVTKKNNDSENNASGDECDWQTYCASENDNEDINSNFNETDVKKEVETLKDSDSDMEYMTNCQVVLTRLDGQDDQVVVDGSCKKQSRKNVRHVFPGRTFTGVKNSGKLLKLTQQRKLSSNEVASRRLKKKSLIPKKKVNPFTSGRFRCVWCCGIRFVCEDEFAEHKNVRHNGQDSIPCEHCQEVIPINSMSGHLFKTHKIKSRVPRPTKKVSNNEDVVIVRDDILGGKRGDKCKKQRGYTCQYCGTIIHYADEFDTHMTQHKEYNEFRKPGKHEFPYICCNLTLANENALSRHKRMKHDKSFLKEKCRFCEKFYPKQTLRAHLKTSHSTTVEKETIKTFQCPKCDLKFAGLKPLTKHQKSNNHQLDICCGIDNCPKVFSTVESYSNHQKYSHLGEMKFPCKICSKSFRSGYARAAHEAGHEMEEKIVCTECGKEFKNKRGFQKHSKRHSDAKLGPEAWKCRFCGKCFANSDSLQNHRRSHREETKNICTCEVCGKTTSNMTNMRKHQRIHDPSRSVKQKYKSSEAQFIYFENRVGF